MVGEVLTVIAGIALVIVACLVVLEVRKSGKEIALIEAESGKEEEKTV